MPLILRLRRSGALFHVWAILGSNPCPAVTRPLAGHPESRRKPLFYGGFRLHGVTGVTVHTYAGSDTKQLASDTQVTRQTERQNAMTNTTTRPRCAQHPAFDADYCPTCGTCVPISERATR